MANYILAPRFRAFIALCAALILLSIVAHLMADVAWGSPSILITKNARLQCPACHLLDSLALPMLIIVLTSLFAICLLSLPTLSYRTWLPAPLVRPPLYAS